jgi:hypothetical protein
MLEVTEELREAVRIFNVWLMADPWEHHEFGVRNYLGRAFAVMQWNDGIPGTPDQQHGKVLH